MAAAICSQCWQEGCLALEPQQHFHDDNAYSHLVFDRAGRFDRLYYHQDDWDSAYERFKDLLSESDFALTFDALISACIDDIIERLIELKQEQEQDA